MKKELIIKYCFVLSGIIILLLIPEQRMFEDGHSLCIHKYLFGFECPLCRMSRASYRFLQFRMADAASLNFNIFPLAFYFLSDVSWNITGRRLFLEMRKFSFYLLAAGLVIIYIYRIIQHFHA